MKKIVDFKTVDDVELLLEQATLQAIPYKLLRDVFDVRLSAKVLEVQVEQIATDIRDDKKVRPGYASTDLVQLDGRNYFAATARVVGGSTPEVEAFILPFAYDELNEHGKEIVKTWALNKNALKGAFKRAAIDADVYQRIKDLKKKDWSDEEVRRNLSGSFANSTITRLLATAATAAHNEMADKVRGLLETNKKISAEEAIVVFGGNPKNEKLLRAARTPRSSQTGRKGNPNSIRVAKFAATMARIPRSLEKHAQELLDSFREGEAGRVGCSSKVYTKELQVLEDKRNNFNHIVDGIIACGVRVMGLESLPLKTDKKRKAMAAHAKR